MKPFEINGKVHSIREPQEDEYPVIKLILELEQTNQDFAPRHREFEFKKNAECPAKVGDDVRLSFWLNGNLGKGRFDGRVFNHDVIADCVVLETSDEPADLPF